MEQDKKPEPETVHIEIAEIQADDPDRFVAGLIESFKNHSAKKIVANAVPRKTGPEELQKLARELLEDFSEPLRAEIKTLRGWLTEQNRENARLLDREHELNHKLREYTASLAEFAVSSLKHAHEREELHRQIAELKLKVGEAQRQTPNGYEQVQAK